MGDINKWLDELRAKAKACELCGTFCPHSATHPEGVKRSAPAPTCIKHQAILDAIGPLREPLTAREQGLVRWLAGSLDIDSREVLAGLFERRRVSAQLRGFDDGFAEANYDREQDELSAVADLRGGDKP